MTDPFYMLMLMKNLGNDYMVWDQSAKVQFLKPGRTHLCAHFYLDSKNRQAILQQLQVNERILVDFVTEVKDVNDECVARVEKTIYIRKKTT